MSDTESLNEPIADLSNPDVVTKYKAAAEIANKAIAAVIAACKDGAKIVDVCDAGDAVISKECANVYNAKKGGQKIQKGVAFPTCVSVNSTVGHFSPLADDTTTLKAGDVVKIDLGAHIDGFIATQATTIVVQPDAAAPITGRAADVIQAARTAFDAALRLMRPGHKVGEVAPVLNSIAEAYGCQVVEGVMSHQMSQFIIDGNKCVLNRPGPDAKVEDQEFEENEVYAIDIVISTGEGKPRVLDEKSTTIYKRALDMQYNLKLRASRAVCGLVDRSFPAMPFTTRALAVEGEKEKEPITASQMGLGLKECLNHGLLHSYPVLVEKGEELVAQIKGTVLLMPNGSDVVTKAPAPQALTSDKKVEDAAILELLAQPIKKQKKKNKDKKKEEGATA